MVLFMPVKRFFFAGTLSIFCLITFPAMLSAESLPDKKVFIVHSYHETQKGHVVEMTRGIRAALKDCRPDTLYFHMDTKRRNSVEWKVTSGKMAAAQMKEYGPDVVIAMDDNAQAFFVKNYVGMALPPAFVFGGVNAEPEKYGFPAVNVTGVIERPNIKESIDLLLKLSPDIKTIVMLSDKSPTTDPFHEYAARLDLPVQIIGHEQPKTVVEWKAVVEKYKAKADAFGVYVVRTILDTETGKMADEKELVRYLNESVKKPTVGFFDTAARAGLLCGISVSMEEQGYAAGQIACEILRGKKPAEIQVQPTSRGRIQLNLPTAEFIGVNIPYSVIRNANEVIKE